MGRSDRQQEVLQRALQQSNGDRNGHHLGYRKLQQPPGNAKRETRNGPPNCGYVKSRARADLNHRRLCRQIYSEPIKAPQECSAAL
jgi:hypothetical protein